MDKWLFESELKGCQNAEYILGFDIEVYSHLDLSDKKVHYIQAASKDRHAFVADDQI
jgi:hypothetical protein